MKFSVVIPLFNKELFISRCLDSVLSQTETDYEVLIVDDGSTDSSITILEHYLSDKRVKLLRQENHGPGAARNYGATYANGSWIAFIDADDAWNSHHLAELSRIITEFPNAAFIATSINQCSTHWKITFDHPISGKLKKINYFASAARNMSVIQSSSVAIEKSVFRESGGFKHWYMAEDQDLWARLALCYEVMTSSARTVYYFRGTNGLMEMLHESLGNEKEDEISRIEDINPVVSLLVNQLNSLNYSSVLYKSIIQYINARITIRVESAFYNGYLSRSKRFSKFYLNPKKGKALLWSKIFILPQWLLKNLMEFRLKLRMNYRIFKSYLF